MNNKILPISILVSGVLIAGSVMFTSGGGGQANLMAQGDGGRHGGDSFENSGSAAARNIRKVEKDEHIRGDKNAQVSIIEFSDFECPFCSRIHPTLSQIVEEFDGEVNWVYRHFPLSSHPRAIGAAIASECIAELGGNEAFWEFGDKLFEGQHNLGHSMYLEAVREMGILENDFTACADGENAEAAVAEDLQDATRSGGRGTPYVVVLNEAGDPFPFFGALPIEQIRRIVEQALNS